jgi:hypothetical protein
MLRAFGSEPSKLLSPEADAIAELRALLSGGADGLRWHVEASALLSGPWRDQVTAAAAIAIGGADEALCTSLWSAIDGTSWVVPQLVAAALLADPSFESCAADRLGSPMRRPPKTIGALVRAYNRGPARRMPVIAQLGVHDRTMATEVARIGIRGVDAWLDYFAGSSRAS